MSGFTEIASSRGMKKIYEAVVEKINLPKHPKFLDWPIKILDIGGGIGMVGQLLYQQCEGLTGKLSPEDFAVLVDYVNIDLDQAALNQSPGRTRWENATFMYGQLKDESPFDYVLELNPNPAVEQFPPDRLARMGLKDGFMGNIIRDNLMSVTHTLRALAARATLISAALVLREGGFYLESGFIEQVSFQGTVKVSKELGLGLGIAADDHIELDEDTLDSFVTLDTGKANGKQFAEIKEEYRKMYRLVTLRARGVSTLSLAQADLTKTLQKSREWSNY